MLTKCASLFIDTGLRNVTLTSKAPESKLLRLSMEQELLEDKLYSLTAIVCTYSLSLSQTGFLSRVVAQAGKREWTWMNRNGERFIKQKYGKLQHTIRHATTKSHSLQLVMCVCGGGRKPL